MGRRSAPALVALAITLGACAIATESRPRVVDDKSVPFELLERDARPLVSTPPEGATEDVALCYVRDERLVVQTQQLKTPVRLRDVVDGLAQPPPELAARTAFGGAPLVAKVELQAGVVNVDLTNAVATLGGKDQLLAIAQLVCTLTARPGVGQVAFTLAGAPVDVPRADGSLTSEPVARDDYAALL